MRWRVVTRRVGLVALVTLACQPSFEVLWCGADDNCPNGFVCQVGANRCVLADAGTVAGGAAGGASSGGDAGGAAGGQAGGSSGGAAGGTAMGGGDAGGVSGGGSAGGNVGGAPGGGAAGGMPGNCRLDVDCGQPSACNVPTCVPPGRCESRPVDAGVLCRPAAGPCDTPESCDGTSTECPMDVVTPMGRACGPDAGDCEVQSTCDGRSVTCGAPALRDAGTLCRQLDVCLPPQVCTGASATCPPPPVDAGTRCDDGNLCSAGTCLSNGCSYSLLATPLTRGLLQGSLDAGVTVISLPRGPTITSGLLISMISTQACAGGSVPPSECLVELDLRSASFIATPGALFTGTGVVQLRAPNLRLRSMPSTVVQPFNWSASLGQSGCQNGLPVNVMPVQVPIPYRFPSVEPDAGTISMVTVNDLRTTIANNLDFCLPGTGLTTTSEAELRDDARAALSTYLNDGLQVALQAAIRRQLCLRPERGVCALGTPNNLGQCVDGSGACYSAHHFRPAIPTIPACVP